MSSPAPDPPRVRFTLGQVMIAVAVTAMLCSMTMQRGGTFGPSGVLVLRSFAALVGYALATIAILVTVRSLVETALGVSCPNCNELNLARVAMSSFGYRYYRCSSCGWRCKRRPLTTWEDACGPEDDEHYRRKAIGGPPGLVPRRDEDDAYWKGTTGALLQNQRGRKSVLSDPTSARPGPEPDQTGSSGTEKTRETGAPG
jgi:predicted RNA-binding Zn-ribbon protein involved in translation (DUF1610 family)